MRKNSSATSPRVRQLDLRSRLPGRIAQPAARRIVTAVTDCVNPDALRPAASNGRRRSWDQGVREPTQ
jgi:hypothetical protein